MHGDPCPDNVLLAPDGTAKLIDFEFASPGHALMDAAYWRMGGFPTCWCAGRVPDSIADRIDRAYREILATAVPFAADDDAFRLESAVITAVWLFGSMAWLLEAALGDDETWGISTRRRPYPHDLDAAIRTTAEAEILPGTRQAATAWRDDLEARWPSSSPLATYPAFAKQPG